MFRESGTPESLATTKADHGDAYKQLPVRGEHKMLAVATSQGPNSSKMRVSASEILVFRTSNAALRYKEVLRLVAKIALRWLRIPRHGYCGDFGIATSESPTRRALPAFTDLNEISGF